MSSIPNKQSRTVQLPGFGRRIDAYPYNVLDYDGQRLRFPHAISDFCESAGVTVRERRMLDFINKITDKPEWERKVFDEAIVAKWRGEACVWNADLNDHYLSSTMFDNCVEELRDKATYYQQSGLVSVLDSETAVAKSDRAVSADLADSLRQCVRVLEEVPDHAKDWHPGSDQKVLDLLHPSLFPLIYGRSKALPSGTVPLDGCNHFIGSGEAVDQPLEQKGHSRKTWGGFQWLPSEIRFAEDGSSRITSYVNNLPPHAHKDLYGVLEKFVAAAIPLWNESLSWFEPRLRFKHAGGSDDDFKLPDGATFPGVPKDEDGYDEEDEEDEEDEVQLYQDWFEANKILIQIEPEPFQSRQLWESKPAHNPVDLQKGFRDSGLQVIFKLANIHLTPEKPSYDGGSWHIEGAMNEHICASALYYYDEENIDESHIAFRQPIDANRMHEACPQDEYESLELYYGVKNEVPAIQTLGSVHTRPGRLLTFPNTLQHQVQPFKLTDPSKPGHRKILAMFLVDPYVRVLSTANVPPQRKEWWVSNVLKIAPLNALPREIFDLIMRLVDGPLSWEEAVEARQELMNERGALVNQENDRLEENNFFFCEH